MFLSYYILIQEEINMKKIILILLAFTTLNSAYSATFYVRTTYNSNPNYHMTVNGALNNVNLADGDTIDVLGIFTESNLKVTKSVTIMGHGIDQTIIQGNTNKPTKDSTTFSSLWKSNPVFIVGIYSGGSWSRITANVNFKNLTIRHGLSAATSNGFQKAGGLMVMRNSGTVLLENVYVVDNMGQYSGSSSEFTGGTAGSSGGIYMQGSVLLLSKCFIANNFARYQGGGLCAGTDTNNAAGSNGTLTITNSTFANNECGTSLTSTGGNGGAIAIDPAVGGATGWFVDFKLENSTLYGNKCRQYGAGIYSKPLKLTTRTNDTISVKLTINHTTIANNSVTTAAKNNIGVYLEASTSPVRASMIINNCLIAGNYNSADATGNTASTTTLCQLGAYGSGKLAYASLSNNIAFHNISTAELNFNNFTEHKMDTTYNSLVLASNLSTEAVPVLKFGDSSIAKDFVKEPNNASTLTTDAIGNQRVGKPDAGAFENQTLSSLHDTNQHVLIQLQKNPVDDILLLKGIDTAKISIYTELGQLLITTTYQNGVNVSNLPAGMYMARVNNIDCPQSVIRFLKY